MLVILIYLFIKKKFLVTIIDKLALKICVSMLRLILIKVILMMGPCESDITLITIYQGQLLSKRL